MPGYISQVRDMRQHSLDSEEYELDKLKQSIDHKGGKYSVPKHKNGKIYSSQSAHHLLESNAAGRYTPDKAAYGMFDKRKFTDELINNVDYITGSKLDRLHDETRTSLEMDYSLLDTNDPIIIDKGIMKFHPGFSVNYVSRWVHVTSTVIRFYKNYYHSVCNFRRPLAVIPLSAVGEVKKFKLVPKTSNAVKHLGKNVYDHNQFEIVLKEDYEAIYGLNKRKREVEDLKYDLELVKKLDFQNKLRNKYKKYRKKHKKNVRFSKSPAPTFRLFLEHQKEEIKYMSRSNPRLSAYSKLYEDDHSKYDTKTNKSHEFLRAVSSIILTIL
jgi:hypothetical protein